VGGRIAGVGWAGLGNRLSIRARALAVAGEDADHASPITGASLALRALHEQATAALAVAGSVLPTGGGRAGDADRRIVGCHPPRNQGTDARRAGQIAGHAGLPAGRGATHPVHAESGPALPVAATGFSHFPGLAGRFRRTGVGLGNVSGFAIPSPAIAKVAVAELGRRATNGSQGKVHKNGNWLPHGSSPASCQWSVRTVAILRAPHRAFGAACTARDGAADLLAGVAHAGIFLHAVACGVASWFVAAPG
jgi:hypothetical protein